MKFKSQIVMFLTGNTALQIKLTNLKGLGYQKKKKQVSVRFKNNKTRTY